MPDLCGLALAWTTGEVPPPSEQKRRERSAIVLDFLSQRARAVAERAARGEARQLLAAPTHRGAWVDPLALVERSRALTDPNALDAIQAMLRLAPDNRPAALRKSAKVPGEFGDALRYALGAKDCKIGSTASLWVAAARARRPCADDPEVERRHPGLGPDAGTAARLRLVLLREGKFDHLRVAAEPALPTAVPLACPTVLLNAGLRVEKWYSPLEHWDAAAVRWAGSVWPQCWEPWFACGAFLIGCNLDWWEASWGNRAYLEPLLEPDVPLRHMGLTLLTLGLAAKEPGESGLATDALIAAIDDGRLDGLQLGARMSALLALCRIKPPRWAKTLAEAARVSPLHAAVVTRALERMLANLPDPVPKDLLALLELLTELLIAGGKGLALPEARASLGALQASGKTAKLAREIVALQDGQSLLQTDAAARALKGRVERAERWARS